MTINKNKTILSLLLIAYVQAFSQNAEPVVTWGKELENTKPGKSNITQIIKSDATGTYAIREEGSLTDHHYILEKYDGNFNRSFSLDITPSSGVMGNSNLVNKVLVAKSNVIVLCDGWNKAEKTGSCNAFAVSMDGAVPKDPVVLDRASAEKQMKTASYYFDVSDDGSKLLVLTQLPYEKETMEKGRVKCFETSTLKELWSKDIDFGVPSDKSPDNNIIVSNDGSAFIFKKIKMDKNVWKYALYSFNNGNMKKEDVDLGDKVFNNSKMSYNSKGDLIIYGTYATGRWTGKESQGTIYLRADATSKAIVTKKDETWSPEIVKAFFDGTIGGKAGSVIPMDYKFIQVRSDGSILAMFEDNKEDKTAVPGSTSFQYSYTYTSKNILVLCIGSDGGKLWHNVVPKNQQVQTSSELRLWDSFCYGMMGDRLLIFYGKTDVPYMWKDAQGREIMKEKIFGKRVVNPTCMVMIEGNGTMKGVDYYYGWKEKTGLPLLHFMDGASFEMSLQPIAFYTAEDGIILYAEMPGQQRFKLGKLKL